MHMQCEYPKPKGANPLPSPRPTKGQTLYRRLKPSFSSFSQPGTCFGAGFQAIFKLSGPCNPPARESRGVPARGWRWPSGPCLSARC